MKVKYKWHSGLFELPICFAWALMIVVDALSIFNGLWPMAIAASLVPLLSATDHALWNVSGDEDKYYDTVIGCGFRALFRKKNRKKHYGNR